MTEAETIERENVRWLNDLAMQKVLEESGATLRAASAHTWRPTVRVRGNITGVFESVTIVATDGLLGLFQMHDTTWNFAHIMKFDGEVKALHSSQSNAVKEKKIKSKTKTKSKKQLLKELYDSI